VNRDSVESHASFAGELGLPFPLLADTQEKLCAAYGTLVEREREDGTKYLSVQRATFLIDKLGVIRKVWPKVSIPEHAAEVLTALRALEAA
jgi:peroxiredoxin Q/BCP